MTQFNSSNIQDTDLDSVASNVYAYFFDRRGGTEEWHDYSSEGPDGDKVLADQKWFWDLDSKTTMTLDYTNHLGESHTLFAYHLAQNTAVNRTVIIYHGMQNNGRMMGNIVKVFYDLGFNVLVPDLRGHGRSDENAMNFSIIDAQDCVRWVDEVAKQADVIYLYGVSIGGCVAWKAAAELQKSNFPKEIQLVVDATTPDLIFGLPVLFDMNADWAALNVLDKLVARNKINALFQEKQGANLDDALSLSESTNCKNGLLLIHGLADTYIPPSIAENAFNSYIGTPKKSLFVAGANHPQSQWWDYNAYNNAIADFVNLPK